MKKEWFVEWFDSPYYHTLYKNRDEYEAKSALGNLLRALDLKPGARLLDLACGKGRHSRYLAEKGFDVTGLDISASNIDYARQFEHDRLSFYQHDMRLPFRINYFDAVMNMFTSFGYFKNDNDHLDTLKNVRKGLKAGGLFLLDYFNSDWVKSTLKRSEVKTVDGIDFQIKKYVRGGYVYKKVEFTTGGASYLFRERVRLFTAEDFKLLLASAGMELHKIFGDYDLSAYDPQRSPRLILIAQKPAQI